MVKDWAAIWREKQELLREGQPKASDYPRVAPQGWLAQGWSQGEWLLAIKEVYPRLRIREVGRDELTPVSLELIKLRETRERIEMVEKMIAKQEAGRRWWYRKMGWRY